MSSDTGVATNQTSGPSSYDPLAAGAIVDLILELWEEAFGWKERTV
jgi:hypothetical protein